MGRRLLLRQITCGLLLLLAVSATASPKLKSKLRSDEDERDSSKDTLRAHHHKRKQLEDEIDLDRAFDLEQLESKQLPILPPIILLDFVNGTSDDNSTSDEKSKRTIDGSLGYGFSGNAVNSLFSGKHNYYFPAGKTGTAVSIEESISPFEPKTVTEVVKPITEKTDASGVEDEEKDRSPSPLFEAMPDPLPLMGQRESLPVYPPYPVFGQRTKLQKTATSEFDRRPPGKLFSAALPTTATTTVLDGYNRVVAYAPGKPVGYASLQDYAGSPNVNRYARPMTSSYLADYMTGKYASGQKTSVDGINQEINLADYPKYSVENGVRYEHKIVWKYPDGKISESPPASYVESYSDFSAEQQKQIKTPTPVGGFRPSLPLQPRPQTAASYNPYLIARPQNNNIYSPRPVQFPDDQEQPNSAKQPSEPSRFVSSSSSSSSPDATVSHGSDYEGANSYNPAGSQRGQYGIRYSPKLSTASHRPAVSYSNQFSNYANHQPAVKYPVVDYSYATQGGTTAAHSGNLFSSDGQINKHVLAKYTPEVQNYLSKVFSGKRMPSHNNYYHHHQHQHPQHHQQQGEEAGSYANTDYSSLLNYNPSISQYIKNPSSILKAQPTFIQAGSSLIPVIILRVDGTPPIQAKPGPNVNLKSLLRQYLTQYANSVSKASQNTNYDFGGAIGEQAPTSHRSNPVDDLKQLTETLESLRQRGHQDPDFVVGSYSHDNAHQQSYVTQQQQQQPQQHATSYSEYVAKVNGGQEVKKQQKVKSVQIIEDPRYTSYKVNNGVGK